MRQLLRLSACVLGLSLMVGNLPAFAGDTIKLGLVGPWTGPAAFTGLTARGAWELVAKQVNDAGGIKVDGVMKKIEVSVADSQSKPDVGVAGAQKLLVRDNVDILVGDMPHSDVTLAIMELAESFKDKIFYTPLAVSSEISRRIAANPEKYGTVWKWDQDSDGYGITTAAFAKYLQESGREKFPNKTFAVVSEQTDYSQTIIADARKRLEQDGWKMVTNEAVPIGYSDFYPQLSKIKQLKPDLIVSIFTAANSGIALVKQLKEQSVTSNHFAIYYPSFAPFKQGIGDAGNGLTYAAVMVDPKRSAKHKAFADMMTEAKIAPTTDALLGYCSAQVLMDAIRRAGSVAADKLGAALAATDNRECPNGIRLVFDPKTHAPVLGPDYFFVSVGQIQDGDHVIVWPPREATGPMKP